MMKLEDLEPEQYAYYLKYKMLFELYPEATGNFLVDTKKIDRPLDIA